MAASDARPTVLHYVGHQSSRGGTIAALQALAQGSDAFASILGVGPGYPRDLMPALPTLEFPAVGPDRIDWACLWRARAVARCVRTWLAADGTRVFHAHSRPGLLVALWLRRWRQSRVLATVHVLGRQRWFYRFAARRLGADLHWLGPAMKRHYQLRDPSWEGCLPDCVPAAAWRAAPRLPRRAGRVTFGCAGALVPIKQWELVLEALARLPAGAPINVIHAGGEDGTPESAAYAAELRRRVAPLGLNSRVEWWGEMPDLQDFFATIDCLLVASRWEASSMAALEALVAGVPVLASDAAGTRDLVATARGGWLFQADSPAGLATAWQQLATGDVLTRWQRDETALRAFTAPVVAARHAALYRAKLMA
ncbi:glycosyltransferase family 4 protein [Opitutus sp. ER46]|uniref:glycosyltransferase family 4 protein n=1 Tax=Opitutus sp. ER46 TaxID=2161864 RepID=UPI000D30893B|nr:glycosyltransferase family 4 protein [Opitutus sp. ER46]PTX95628.1 hypothetical protein DB354_09435 [Opitutus sp. ER46]